MTDDLGKMLAEEAEHAELHKDAAPGPDTKISRPNRARSHVFSVRLNDAEMKQLAAVAARAAVPPSTMARSLITQQLAESIAKYNRQLMEQMAAPITEAQRQLSSEAVKAAQAAAQEAMRPAIREIHEGTQKLLGQHKQEIQDIIRRAAKA